MHVDIAEAGKTEAMFVLCADGRGGLGRNTCTCNSNMLDKHGVQHPSDAQWASCLAADVRTGKHLTPLQYIKYHSVPQYNEPLYINT